MWKRWRKAGKIFFDAVRHAVIMGACGEQIPECLELFCWLGLSKDLADMLMELWLLVDGMRSLLIMVGWREGSPRAGVTSGHLDEEPVEQGRLGERSQRATKSGN